MKVKNKNINAIRTEEKIKNSLIKFISEKKELSEITVTELVKDAELTRSSFYTHYNNIYEVAKDIQNDTIKNYINDDIVFNSYEDVCNYIDNTIVLLKSNEDMYRKIASNYESILFFDEIRDTFVKKMYDLLVKSNLDNSNTLIDVNFFMDGMLFQIIKYFKNTNNSFTLEELGERVKVWLKELFL